VSPRAGHSDIGLRCFANGNTTSSAEEGQSSLSKVSRFGMARAPSGSLFLGSQHRQTRHTRKTAIVSCLRVMTYACLEPDNPGQLQHLSGNFSSSLACISRTCALDPNLQAEAVLKLSCNHASIPPSAGTGRSDRMRQVICPPSAASAVNGSV
jgi:hypothetical protein